jgi:hypothetical protein
MLHFRLINAVIAKPLVDQFGLDAGQLGVLTSGYFLTFAAVQLAASLARPSAGHAECDDPPGGSGFDLHPLHEVGLAPLLVLDGERLAHDHLGIRLQACGLGAQGVLHGTCCLGAIQRLESLG